ncbi:comF family protein [[Eubacterium] yurii subsp. margaretiae ATCC 43715]|nr:comF family protein [[Eubacterium] yurii subsp. margaretiae ATCC 43715]
MGILFPENIYCISCNEPISDSNKFSLCKNCYENIEFLYDKNTIFDKEVMELLKNDYISKVHITTIYNDIMKNMIHGIKYSNKTYLAKFFASMMCELIEKKLLDFDYITFVPIHKKRLMERGYNQVELIVKHIGKWLNKPVIKTADRVKTTRSMYELSFQQRHIEMKDAFKSKAIDCLQGKNLLLVDDILTTGATVKNLCEAIYTSNKDINIQILLLSRGSLK